MTVEQIKAELCKLGYAERIQRCREMLQNPAVQGEARWHVLYFLCHALQQLEIGQPREALQIAELALQEPLDADLWEKFAVSKALALHELGWVQDLPKVLDDIRDRHVAPVARGYELALRGMLLSGQVDAAAFDLFRQAEALFSEVGHHYGCARVQLAASSLALKLHRFDDAREWAGRVEYPLFRPTARLLEAEALHRSGQTSEALALLERAESGAEGALVGEDPARCCYLAALMARDRGDMVTASRCLAQADRLLLQQQRKFLDLRAAIAGLRASLMREGVA